MENRKQKTASNTITEEMNIETTSTFRHNLVDEKTDKENCGMSHFMFFEKR